MSEQWLREAKTAETRASIRRWYRWNNFFFWIGVVCFIGGTVFIGHSVSTHRDHGFEFWVPLALIAAVVIACVGFGAHTGGLLIEARFADGEESVGVVEESENHSTEGPDITDFVIRSWVDGAMIRRRITGMTGTSRVGDRVAFRHNTSDPDAMDDIQFVGWRGNTRNVQQMMTDTPRGKESFSGTHLSIGRVTGVTTLASLDGAHRYRLDILIERSAHPPLHRQIDLVGADLRTSGPAIRPLVLVRHDTWEPDDLADVFFERWAKDEA